MGGCLGKPGKNSRQKDKSGPTFTQVSTAAAADGKSTPSTSSAAAPAAAAGAAAPSASQQNPSASAPPPASAAAIPTSAAATAAAALPPPKPPANRPKGGEIVTQNPFPDLVGRDIGEFYELGKELGRGEFGVTCLATQLQTREKFACKSIPKRKLRTAVDIEDVRREVAIMHHLPRHPNIVGLKGVFEDRHAVHIVQELCEGGELFERIIARGHYTERAAAFIMRTIVEVVQVCHTNGVMHRDLKPENFLFADNKEDSALRAIDFGLSIMFTPGEKLSEIVGSPYYMAPEVLRKNYGPLADVWSAGVILYILLCGVPPFWAETEQGVAQAVLRAEVDLQRDPWPDVSDSAKDLVMRMLEPDVSRRPSAEQVLLHPWLKHASQAPDTPLGAIVLERMKQFQAMNKLKKKALLVIADQLSADEVAGLQEVFKIIDADGSGTITLDELRTGLQRIGSTLSEVEVKALLDAADLDGNGLIDYQEWVAATMHLQRVDNEKNLRAAFEYFDSDGSGFIDLEELADALGADLQALREVLAEVDTNNDGKISWEEFVHMMRKGSELRNASRHFSKSRSSLRSLLRLSDLDLKTPPPEPA